MIYVEYHPWNQHGILFCGLSLSIDFILYLQNALGLELWSMSDEIVFDNFIITDDKVVASSYASQTWEIKSSQEKAVSGGVNTFYFNTQYYVENNQQKAVYKKKLTFTRTLVLIEAAYGRKIM